MASVFQRRMGGGRRGATAVPAPWTPFGPCLQGWAAARVDRFIAEIDELVADLESV